MKVLISKFYKATVTYNTFVDEIYIIAESFADVENIIKKVHEEIEKTPPTINNIQEVDKTVYYNETKLLES